MAKEVNEIWVRVDQYIEGTVARNDEVLEAVTKANAEAELPAIDVTASQGKFLHVLALAVGARRVLEIGTLGGYSTIWLARAVGRGGRVVTLEYEPKHVTVAKANLKRAGLGKKVEIRVGAAADSLARLVEDGASVRRCR
jgi:predicted O-methyltransferase YrrM